MRHKHSVTEDPVKLVAIAAIAASIGAVVAMLFTPRNGNEVRSGLKRRAAHVKDEVQGKLDDNIEEVGDTAEDAKQRLQTTVDKVVKDSKTTVNKASNDAKVIKRRATKAAEAAKPTTRKKPSQSQ